ncbi:hypothetical protein BV898_10918 [Hypsibius exemplaris]|uniref:Uncharacterized protein n=1 Tax=Hypsibius exemplaris TaxID=2072580 RepID=A0A1W0WI69_HYPEX|nr:hypothetical protein BV898_10918 [Hypsibius exemplaris]
MYRLEGIDQDWLANRSIIHNETTYRKHSDRTMILTPDNNTYFQMDFLWSGDIEMVVKNFIYYALGQRRLKNATKRTYREANLFVITGSPWQFTKCTRQERLVSGCTTEYQRLFLKFLVLLRRSGLTSPVLWVPQTPLDNIREKYLGVTNDQMRGYNAVVETAILSYNWTSFIYWKSYEKAFSLQDSLDGIHLGPRAKEKDVSFLLDYICHLATGIFCQQESI